MPAQSDRISQNVETSKAVSALIDLGFDLARESCLDAQHVRLFWQNVIQSAGDIVNDPPLTTKEEEDVHPMSNAECRRFECKIMPWGKHKGEKIRDVPLAYLAFIADKPDEFKEDCKRYLLNDRIQNEYDRAD